MELNLKELIKKPEYKWIEEYRDRLCFLTLGGSFGYGTNVEGSDIDIRGVMLPTKEELIGLKSFEQRIDDNTDTVIYGFGKFIHLVSQTNPNTIELLGGRQYLIFNEVGQQLIDQAKIFLSKRCINTFGGYANSQLRRVENALCHDSYDEEKALEHIRNSMEVAMTKLEEKNELFFEHAIKTKVEKDKLLMSIHFDDKPIELIRATLNDLLTIEHTYNKLGQRNNKKSEQKLDKHVMHLVRLYHMCFDLLERAEINTYREKDREFLLEIRNGKFIKNGELTQEFRDYMEKLEERFQKDKELNVLPDKPNYKEIEKFVIEVNEKVINNKINKYEEPQELIRI